MNPVITNILPVEYHLQDDVDSCGAACALMVLNEIGAGYFPQPDLMRDIQLRNIENWASDPNGLTQLMINRKPATFRNTFVPFRRGTVIEITRKTIWTIFHYNVAPIVLVYGWHHWLVVKGYEVDINPSNINDTGYVISGLWLNDPAPSESPGPPPLPLHSRNDGCINYRSLEHVDYEIWESNYLTEPVPSGGSGSANWGGDFIAICDPEPISDKIGIIKKMRKVFPGKRLIRSSTAAKLAKKALIEQGLINQSFLLKLLENVEPSAPALVKRLDINNDYYYLVPMIEAKKNINAIISIDGRFGNYRQSAFANDILHPLKFIPLTRSQILSALGSTIKINEYVTINIYPKAVTIYPMLVWRPCRESMSPYWPFHLINLGHIFVYVRLDGKVFTHLTTDVKGI